MVPHAVPSTLKGLTAVFGMGTGVSPSLLPPAFFCQSTDVETLKGFRPTRVVNSVPTPDPTASCGAPEIALLKECGTGIHSRLRRARSHSRLWGTRFVETLMGFRPTRTVDIGLPMSNL
jgi:hypothetical protein